jgi:spore maturation protein CgeD
MPVPKVTIFTCSYNKPQYVADAINSVLGQTFENFEYIILENSTDDKTKDVVRAFKDSRIKIIDVEFSKEWREKQYAESRLKNIYSPQAQGEYIMYLADDDVLEPNCFEEHLKEFEVNKNQRANYHGWRIVYLDSSEPDAIMLGDFIFGEQHNPRNWLDGGAIMFEKSLLKELPRPYFKSNWFDACISDSLFATKLSLAADIHPINKVLHTKRVTKISTHRYVDSTGQVVFAPRGTNIS